MRSIRSFVFAFALFSCVHGAKAPPSTPPSDAHPAPNVDVAVARAEGRTQAFEWLPYDATTFAKAKKERRFILLDGAAEWCHWCHVMDATTYRDPQVGALLASSFVAIRIDVDARPDLAERYGEWGWPATILLSPDAEELGKFRGYLSADRLLEALHAVASDAGKGGVSNVAGQTLDVVDRSADVAALPWVAARTFFDLDGWYDDKEGGWGSRQKAPIGANLEAELARARHGDGKAKARVAFTIEKQRALIDRVWGGLYQYSAASDWNAPHFEKLMTVQAAAIEAYARAWELTHDDATLADARAIARYVTTRLSAPNGGFHPNQDADVGAHDPNAPFVDGATYYAKDDAGRRALGTPWIDPHVYARETALAVAALCTLADVTKDANDAPFAERARAGGDALIASYVQADGGVVHDASSANAPKGPRFLADAAATARALARLAEVTKDAKYAAAAKHVAEAIVRDFADGEGGALFDATIDGDAAGVFARRMHPFVHEVVAARAFEALHRVTGDAMWRSRAKATLAAIATPRAIVGQGRWIGELLVALDEVGAIAW